MSDRAPRRPPGGEPEGRVVFLAARRRKPAPAACPICGKPARDEVRPFCSTRCKDVDLGRWLGGRYRIPTDEEPEPGEPPPEAP
jgi:endogenous inhibitor of DNA gyrase (YacG/DUF329 family)